MPTFEPLEGDVVLRDDATETLNSVASSADAAAASMDTLASSIAAATAAMAGFQPSSGNISKSAEEVKALADALSSINATPVQKLGAAAGELGSLGENAAQSSKALEAVGTAIGGAAQQARDADRSFTSALRSMEAMSKVEAPSIQPNASQAEAAPKDADSSALAAAAGASEQLKNAIKEVSSAPLAAASTSAKALTSDMKTVTDETEKATKAADDLTKKMKDMGLGDVKEQMDDAFGKMSETLNKRLQFDLEQQKKSLQELREEIAKLPAAKDSVKDLSTLTTLDDLGKEFERRKQGAGAIQKIKVEDSVTGVAERFDPTGGLLAGPLGNLAGNATAQSMSAIGSAAGVTAAAVGGVAAAVGAVVIGFNMMTTAMEQVDRKQKLFDKLDKNFGDTEEAVNRVQEKIKGFANEDQILEAFQGVEKTSVLTDVENLAAVAEVAKESAYDLGMSWQDTMSMITQAVQSGDFSALENAGFIESGDQALLDYAASIGKIVPQLNKFERQQALLNAVVEEFPASINAVTSPSENLSTAYGTLQSALGDVQTNFGEWIVSLIDPSARSAIEWWAGIVDGFAGGVQGLSNAMETAAVDRRIASSDSISDEDKQVYRELNQDVAERSKEFDDMKIKKFGWASESDEHIQEWLKTDEAAQKASDSVDRAIERVERAREILYNEGTLQGNEIFIVPYLDSEIEDREEKLKQQKETLESLRNDESSLPATDPLKEVLQGSIASLDAEIKQKELELQALEARRSAMGDGLLPQERETMAQSDTGGGASAQAGEAARLQQIAEITAQIDSLRAAYESLTPAMEEYKTLTDALDQLQAGHAEKLARSTEAENAYSEAVINTLLAPRDAKQSQAPVDTSKLENDIEVYSGVIEQMRIAADALDQKIAEGQAEIAKAQDPAALSELASNLNARIAQKAELEQGIADGVATIAEMEERLNNAAGNAFAAGANEDQTAALRANADAAAASLRQVEEQIQAVQTRIRELEESNPGANLSLDAGAMLQEMSELEQRRAVLLAEADAASARAAQATQTVPAAGATEASNHLRALAQDLGALDQQIAQLDGATVSEVLSTLAKASDAVMQATKAEQDALASGNEEQVAGAQAVRELAEAKYAQAEAAYAVAAALLEEEQASLSGDEAAQAAAAAAVDVAAAQYDNAEAAATVAEANVDAAESFQAYIAAQDALAKAQATGNQALVEAAQSDLSLAAARLTAIAATDDLRQSSQELVNIAGVLVDPFLRLPVAFDASTLSANQADAMFRQLTITMQQMEFQAINSALAMTSRLVPSLGVAGAYDVGLGFAAEQDQLFGKFQSVNEQRMSAGQSPIDTGVVDMFSDALASNQQARVTDMMAEFNGVGTAAGGAADAMERATDRITNAIDGMVRSVTKDTTKGLIPLDEMLPREDEIDEDARRMADIAVKGFESPWFEGLKHLFPEDVLQEGGDAVKQAAARMVKEHQDGLTTMFYDVDRAAEQVLKKIKGQGEMDQYVDEVRQKVMELGGEEGLSNEDIADMLGLNDDMETQASAAGRKMATAFTASFEEIMAEIDQLFGPKDDGEGEDGAAAEGEGQAYSLYLPIVGQMTPSADDLTTAESGAQTLATAVGDALVAQAEAENAGGRAMTTIIGTLDAAKADVEASGQRVATWFGTEFKGKLETDIPAGLLEILVTNLVPLMAAATEASNAGDGGGATV